MTPSADRNFILQQGLEAPPVASCAATSSALRFQPRLIGLIAVLGTLSQSPVVFGALAALLWVSALLPRLNPFELVYRQTLGRRSGSVALGPAPTPRRFAQGMAAAMATAIAAALAAELRTTAWVIEALLLLALVALIFGRFCLGSFIYYLVRGRISFALATLPWGRGV